MKNLIVILLVFVSCNGFAQDTLETINRYNNGYTYLIRTGNDSVYVQVDANGHVESLKEFTKTDKITEYTRYYPNGKIMWVHEQKHQRTDGKCFFYNEKGKRILELEIHNDTVTDTLFVHSKIPCIFGRYTYHSVVYGGMVREDGSSNISESSGPGMFVEMYTVKLDSTVEEQSVYKSIITDDRGYFFLPVEKGVFGFFPKHFPISNVNGHQSSPGAMGGSGYESTWNTDGPLTIDKENYTYFHIHVESVGYAP